MNRRAMITAIAAIAAAGVAVPALGLSLNTEPVTEPESEPVWRLPDVLDNSAVPHQNGHFTIDPWAGQCIGQQLNTRRKALGLLLFDEGEHALRLPPGTIEMGTPLVFSFLRTPWAFDGSASTRGSLTEQALNKAMDEILTHEYLFHQEATGSGYELVPRSPWIQYLQEDDPPKYDPANYVVWDLDLWKKGTSANGYLLTQHYLLRRIPA